MTAQFRNLIFEGGGVKGIAYVGAMQVLNQRGILKNIRRVGGTSAGAINALLFTLGFDIPSQLQLLESTNFKKFMDDSFCIIQDINRLTKLFGWFKGDFFSSWAGKLIKEKLGNEKATFKDLKDKKDKKRPDLYMIGTNLSTGYSEVFSHERQPNMPLAEALRISMSIPLFFAAKRYGPRKDVYVDGGVMLNYPIKLFDRERYIERKEKRIAARATEYYNIENAMFLLKKPKRSRYVYNRQTLGMRLDTSEEIALFRYNEPIKGEKIDSFTDYARKLFSAIMHAQENQHLHSDDWQRTIYINTLDVKTTNFSLSDDKKKALLQEGINGAENYFKWFEDPLEKPINKIMP
jgi:NTE family protein